MSDRVMDLGRDFARRIVLDVLDGAALETEHGCWLDTSEWGSDTAHDAAQVTLFCPRHGHRGARLLTRLRGWVGDRYGRENDRPDALPQVHSTECWAGDDSLGWCAAAGCGVPLTTGGLTSYGIDQVLDDTDVADALHPSYATELRACADGMSHDDGRCDLLVGLVLAAVDLRDSNPHADASILRRPDARSGGGVGSAP